MFTLCLVSQGVTINKEVRRLIIVYPDKTKREFPLLNLERIMIFGNAAISSYTIGLICDQGIDLSFLTVRGKFRGKVQKGFTKNVFLREAQYGRGSERDFVMNTAVIIVRGKLKNQRQQLLRFKRNHPEKSFLGIDKINRLIEELSNKNDLESVRGIEGIGSRLYFADFKHMLLRETDFIKRVRRPPGDKVNAVLSLGYTFLVNEMTGILEAIGFDPYYGYLHEPRYGRTSLSLDLIEEFRTPVVDRIVLEAFNKSIFKNEDFIEGQDDHGNKNVLLTEDAINKFLALWERKVGKVGRKREMDLIMYRKEFREQALKFSKYLLENQAYSPFELK